MMHKTMYIVIIIKKNNTSTSRCPIITMSFVIASVWVVVGANASFARALGRRCRREGCCGWLRVIHWLPHTGCRFRMDIAQHCNSRGGGETRQTSADASTIIGQWQHCAAKHINYKWWMVLHIAMDTAARTMDSKTLCNGKLVWASLLNIGIKTCCFKWIK